MAKDWVKQYLERCTSKHQLDARKFQLEQAAASQLPQMFRSLCDQIEQDLNEFRQVTGKPILFHQSRSEFVAEHNLFPTFSLRLTATAAGIATVSTTRKNGGSRSGPDVENLIVIKATAADEMYYSFKGTEYADVSDVSEALLIPLLETLEAK